MNPIRALRTVAGWTQSRLAESGATSQPTIAAYEVGAKSPTWRTITRLAQSAELACYPSIGRPLTRDQARSLALHQAVVDELVADPPRILEVARTNLDRMRRSNPAARDLLEQWDRILRQPVREIAAAVMDPGERGRDLRQVTPFAGVLTPGRRAEVYRSFREAA